MLEEHAHRYYVLDDPTIGDGAVRRAARRAAGDRARASGAAQRGLADPAGRRRAGRAAGEGHAPGADALAAERAHRGGAAGVGRADAQPPRARGDRRARSSSSWSSRRSTGWRSACVYRDGVLRAGGHARQRRDRGGRDAQPAHDRLIPLSVDDVPPLRGGAGRGVHVAEGLRRAQRAPRGGGRVDVHEPAQLGRRDDPPARPGGRREAPAVDVVLPAGRHRGSVVRDALRRRWSG